MNSSTNTNNTVFSPYLLTRFHQHLNHLNDMAFTHTKILQEIIEKRSNEPMTTSPHGSISSSPSSSSSTMDSLQQRQQQQRKRSYPCNDNHEIKSENHLNNKRPRKQSKPQQLLQLDNQKISEQTSSSSSSSEDEEEMGEIIEPIKKQAPPSLPTLPLPPTNLPFLNYIQELARTNNITSPTLMGQFLENLAMESRRIPPLPPTFSPFLSQTQHHPYLSPILFNNSFISSTPSFNRFIPSSTNGPKDHHSNFPFHFSTPKKRRTKVTDTRLSPRIASKIPIDDLSDDEHSSSHHSSDEHPNRSSDRQSIEYNGFQITVLKVYFPDVRFNKLITAQLVKWFSNFREFFYQQIEKYARQCLAEGIRNVEDLIITPSSELYRTLNIHYNRSNQINVPISFCHAVQAALREFFLAIQQQKDLESSWKKSIYKVMGRLDDQLPDFFKNDHWMHSI